MVTVELSDIFDELTSTLKMDPPIDSQLSEAEKAAVYSIKHVSGRNFRQARLLYLD
jgi:hypothetical protein